MHSWWETSLLRTALPRWGAGVHLVDPSPSVLARRPKCSSSSDVARPGRPSARCRGPGATERRPVLGPDTAQTYPLTGPERSHPLSDHAARCDAQALLTLA
jgi:hypothetical protein